MDDIYKYTEEYNPNKNDNDIIAGMLSNKKLRPILTNKYSPLGKAFGKQTNKQVGTIKSLNFPVKNKL